MSDTPSSNARTHPLPEAGQRLRRALGDIFAMNAQEQAVWAIIAALFLLGLLIRFGVRLFN
jgi:hypothetical protein